MIPLSEQQLQQFVDSVFGFIEDAESSRPFIKLLTQEAQAIIDSKGLPALYAFLVSKGIVTPPAA